MASETTAVLDQWVAERCALAVDAFKPTMTLCRDWRAWAGRQDIRVGSVKRFSRAIAARGFERFPHGCSAGTAGSRSNPIRLERRLQ